MGLHPCRWIILIEPPLHSSPKHVQICEAAGVIRLPTVKHCTAVESSPTRSQKIDAIHFRYWDRFDHFIASSNGSISIQFQYDDLAPLFEDMFIYFLKGLLVGG